MGVKGSVQCLSSHWLLAGLDAGGNFCRSENPPPPAMVGLGGKNRKTKSKKESCTPEATAMIYVTKKDLEGNLPLEQQLYYVGPMSRKDAELYLSYYEEGTFLVRQGEQGAAISIRYCPAPGPNICTHMKIMINAQGKYEMGPLEAFDSIPQLIDYYTAHREAFRLLFWSAFPEVPPPFKPYNAATHAHEIERDRNPNVPVARPRVAPPVSPLPLWRAQMSLAQPSSPVAAAPHQEEHRSVAEPSLHGKQDPGYVYMPSGAKKRFAAPMKMKAGNKHTLVSDIYEDPVANNPLHITLNPELMKEKQHATRAEALGEDQGVCDDVNDAADMRANPD